MRAGDEPHGIFDKPIGGRVERDRDSAMLSRQKCKVDGAERREVGREGFMLPSQIFMNLDKFKKQ